jgi:thiol-disulfide isomerase/thioredoxin
MEYILFTLLSFSFLFCQKQNEKYVISTFKNGLPTEIPFKWDNSFYTSINSAKFFKALYFVSRDSLKTPNNCFLFIIEPNGFSYKTVDFENIDKNNYKSTISLVTQDEDKLAPLKLVLNLKEKTFGYIWGDTNKNPTIISEYSLKIGKSFPQIVVNTENGNWTNQNLKKILVLNWWATYCLPCIEEIPNLNALTKKFSNNEVEFLAIVWDKENHSKFIKLYPFEYKQGFGSDKLNKIFGEVFPRHLVISRDGKILFNKLGGSKNIDKELEKVIKENI